jgi:16S rRNA (guanine527-N7)-methyltransferase
VFHVKRPAALIIERCAAMGVDVTPAVASSIAEVLQEMLDEPQNLSSVRDIDGAISIHAVDSLSGLLDPEVRNARSLADLGSGGGFPGLALAAALPDTDVVLVESERAKADWLVRASRRFPNVRVVAERSETMARDERDSHPLVTARALGSLPVVLELAAPLLCEGGSLVAWRGRRDALQHEAALAAAAELGLCHTRDTEIAPIPGVSRHFSVWTKVAPTPARYPRRPGMAAKRPLA